jgi:hypothetical protein
MERTASILISSGKKEEASQVLAAMTKRFSSDPAVWLNRATFEMMTNRSAQTARELLTRALQALPKEAHLDVTSKFAALEYRDPKGTGSDGPDIERGRMMFEGMLGVYGPDSKNASKKRWMDSWSRWTAAELGLWTRSQNAKKEASAENGDADIGGKKRKKNQRSGKLDATEEEEAHKNVIRDLFHRALVRPSNGATEGAVGGASLKPHRREKVIAQWRNWEASFGDRGAGVNSMEKWLAAHDVD